MHEGGQSLPQFRSSASRGHAPAGLQNLKGRGEFGSRLVGLTMLGLVALRRFW